MKFILFSVFLLFSVEALSQDPGEGTEDHTLSRVSPPYTECVKRELTERVDEINGKVYYYNSGRCILEKICRDQVWPGEPIEVSCFCSIHLKQCESCPTLHEEEVTSFGDIWDLTVKHTESLCEGVFEKFVKDKNKDDYKLTTTCMEHNVKRQICTEPVPVNP